MLDDMSQHRELDDVPAALTLRAAAQLLRIRRRWVLVAMAAGSLPVRRRGRQLVIPTDQLLAAFGLPVVSQEATHDHDR